MRSSVSKNARSSSVRDDRAQRPIASSAVHPKISAAPAFHDRTRPSRSKSTIADRRRVDERAVVLVRVLDLLELRGLLERGRRLVRERAQDLQALCVRAKPVGRVVGPDVADAAAAAVRAAGRTASGSATRTGRGRRAASCSRPAGRAGLRAPSMREQEAALDRRTRAAAAARARRPQSGTPMFSPSSKPGLRRPCGETRRRRAAARRPSRSRAPPRSRCRPA